MGIEVYVPAWRPGARRSIGAGNVTAGQPLKVALLANGKPNSAELLERLAHRLGQQMVVAEVRSWRKPSISVPPTPEQFDEIVGWADVGLVAVGD